MSVGRSSSHFEMPSTSGRSACVFEIYGETSETKLAVHYSWAVFQPDVDDPVPHDVVLPPVATAHIELAAMLDAFRRYGLTIGCVSDVHDSVSINVSVAPSQTLCLELRAVDPGLVTAPWQAVFTVQYTNGPSFELTAKYVVDATCLDVFIEGLARSLETVF